MPATGKRKRKKGENLRHEENSGPELTVIRRKYEIQIQDEIPNFTENLDSGDEKQISGTFCEAHPTAIIPPFKMVFPASAAVEG
jgi:hypothetical protein